MAVSDVQGDIAAAAAAAKVVEGAAIGAQTACKAASDGIHALRGRSPAATNPTVAGWFDKVIGYVDGAAATTSGLIAKARKIEAALATLKADDPTLGAKVAAALEFAQGAAGAPELARN